MQPRNAPLFDKLHKEHRRAVLSLVWTLGVPEGEREDVAQEVWATAARHFDGYEDQSPLGWLGTITRNAVKTWRRTRKRRPELGTQVDEGIEPIDLRTPETATLDEQRRHALRAFLFVAMPNEERREAFILHEVFGQTVAEVARTMRVPLETAQARLKMARRDIERTKQAMSDEDRARLRAFVVPFVSVDAMIEELRSSVPDEEVERVSRRVYERLGRDADGVDPVQSAPPDAPSPPTGPPFASAVVAAFLAGVLVGAGVLYAVLSRDKPPPSIATFETVRPVETIPEPDPEPSASPSATTTAPRASSPVETGAPQEAGSLRADSLLARARRALTTAPRDTLAMVQEHAAKFPKRDGAKREEIAIRALVQLGERAEAESRAAQLIVWAPSMRARMADLFGHEFP